MYDLVTMPPTPEQKPTLDYPTVGRERRRFPLRLFITCVIVWILLIFGIWALVVATGASDPAMGPQGAFWIYVALFSGVYLPIAILACGIRWALSRRRP
jgi:hypothetical protein